MARQVTADLQKCGHIRQLKYVILRHHSSLASSAPCLLKHILILACFPIEKCLYPCASFLLTQIMFEPLANLNQIWKNKCLTDCYTIPSLEGWWLASRETQMAALRGRLEVQRYVLSPALPAQGCTAPDEQERSPSVAQEGHQGFREMAQKFYPSIRDPLKLKNQPSKQEPAYQLPAMSPLRCCNLNRNVFM